MIMSTLLPILLLLSPIWVPILIALIIVKIVKSKHNKSQPVATKQSEVTNVATQVVDNTQTPTELAANIQNLEEQIDAELAKDEPDIKKIKAWRAEIAQQRNQPQIPQQVIAAPSQAAEVASMPQNTETSNPPKHKMTGMNVLLYVGGFLIVAGSGSLIIATSASDALKFVILLAIVAIFYVGGLLTRRKPELLPAGNALVGTALAVTPFLGFAFTGLTHLTWEISWLLTSSVGIILYVLAAVLMNSKIIAYFAIAFLMSLVCSISACLQWSMIWYFVALMVVSIGVGLINICIKQEKLRAFASAVQFAGRWLPVIVAAASIICVPQAEPWQYTLICGLGALQTGINWFVTKKKVDSVMARLFTQVFLIVLTFCVTQQNAFWTGIVVAVSAFAQSIASILIGSKDQEKDKTLEQILSIIATFSSLIAFPLLVVGEQTIFHQPSLTITSIIAVIYCILMAGFCAWASTKSKNYTWLFGTIIAMAALPFCVQYAFLHDISINLAYYFAGCYAVLDGIFLAWLWRFTQQHKNELTIVSLSLVATIIASIALFSAGVAAKNVGWHLVFLGLMAISWCITGKLIKRPAFIEIGCYVCLIFLTRIVDAIFHAMSHPDGYLWAACIAHIWGLGLFTIGYLLAPKIYSKTEHTSYARQLIGIIGLSCVMGIIALISANTNAAAWSVVFLIEEITLLVVGVLKKWKWMWITGLIGTILAVMWFTRQIAFVWLIAIGLGLIALVIRKLIKGSKHQK